MGGHFRLALRQVASLAEAFGAFEGRLVCTVPANGVALRESDLRGRLGWIFGAEGRGLSEATARRAHLRVTVPMARGTESLNVAAAAAICFYEAFSRPGAGS
jgi:RNA methyltransferase, TrmH family